MEATVARWGTIHACLTSAGVNWPVITMTPKAPMDTQKFKKVIDINLMGSVNVAKYCSVVFAKNKPDEDGERGVIVFVSSVAASEGNRSQVAYGASKGAINGLVLPMARDLGRYNIRVVAIAPGIFDTPLGDVIPEPIKQGLRAATPMKRTGKPSEFGQFVC